MSKGSGHTTPQYIQAPPSTTTQTTNSQPWDAQAGYLAQVFNQATIDYNKPLQFYNAILPGVPQGQTYAPFSPETLAGMGMTVQQALGDTVTPAAQKFNTDMLSGDYLSAGNPYFQNMVGNIYNTVAPQVESQFAKAGRYGSGSMDKALASAMTDTAGNLAYQNYGNILDQMGKSLYVAPQTAAAGYVPGQQMANVGGMLEDQTQNMINETMARWQFEQMEPWQRLGLLNSMVQGNYGGSQTSTGTGNAGQWYQPTMQNTAGNIIGGLGSLGGLGLLAYSAFSDRRTKENIKPLTTTAMDIVEQVNPVTFDYLPEYGERGQIGFVADEIEKIAPGMVITGEGGMKRILPFAIVPLLVKALQEQQEQIRQLRGMVQK